MPVKVNERVISDEVIEREAAHHADARSPLAAAACALAVRALLLDRASALGFVQSEDDAAACDAAIEQLLEREAPVPEPTAAECRRYYDTHAGEFSSGDIVEAAHILFAVTPNAPVDAIRRQAEVVLKQAVAAPERFGALAKQFSNCPSSAEEGNLGQLSRGGTVPEFERAIFDSDATGVLPQLVSTRYGFHAVKVARRISGAPVEFDAVQSCIAARLRARVRAKAAEQYVRILASRASITGVDLGAAASSLVQ